MKIKRTFTKGLKIVLTEHEAYYIGYDLSKLKDMSKATEDLVLRVQEVMAAK